MELDKINEELERINASLAQDITLKLNEKNLDNISKSLDKIVNDTDLQIFEMDEAELFKDMDDDGKITDFSSFVKSAVANLEKFDKVAYYKSLKDEKDPRKKQDLMNAKENKIKELIAQIENMGQMNTFIKEVEKKYDEKEMESVLNKDADKTTELFEKASKERLALETFKNSSVVQLAFEQLRAIDSKDKKQKEIDKIQKEIDAKNDEISKLSDKDLIDALTNEVKELEGKITSIGDEIKDLDKTIAGKTVDNIKDDIRNVIPDGVDKLKIEKILNGSDIEKGFEDVDQQYLNDMLKYENRTRRKEERTKNLEIGRNERKSRATAKPVTFDPTDSAWDLTDDEIKNIKDAIKKGGLDIDGLKPEDIEDYKNKAKVELFKPEAADKKERKKQKKEDRKNTSQYLKEQNGKGLKGFFKNMLNGVKARNKDVQEEYKEHVIAKKMEELMILDKKQSNFQEKKAEAKKESEAKTAELDELDNSFKAKVRAMAKNMDFTKLKAINDSGEYRKSATKAYSDVSADKRQEADDEFEKGV